jgi:hypothetical protein
MKISSVGGELFWADGRSDMMKLKVVFLNFPNGPKKLKNKLKIHVTYTIPVRPYTFFILAYFIRSNVITEFSSVRFIPTCRLNFYTSLMLCVVFCLSRDEIRGNIIGIIFIFRKIDYNQSCGK